MKDGYYLSTYLHVDELANLLDISVRHDQNIALWKKDGKEVKLIHYWELERLTGLKHHRRSFYNEEHVKLFINELLLQYNITLKDIVDIWGTPRIDTTTEYYEKNKNNICYHSIVHLFSSVLIDSEKFYNENIIGLSVDGAPDSVIEMDVHSKEYYCGCYCNKGVLKITTISSPALLWYFAKQFLGMEEGSLMALAYASKSCMLENVLEPISIKNQQDTTKAMTYVKKLVDKVNGFTNKDIGVLYNFYDNRFTEKENKISMVMKKIQELSIAIMESNIEEIIKQNQIDPTTTYLAISGGYGLNCCTNSHLVNKYKFRGLIVPPCINDGGQALGIGLYTFYKHMERFNFLLGNAYYGSQDDLSVFLSHYNEFSTFIKSVSDVEYEEIVKDILSGPIVWFDEKAEIGPRALGHRSIIADPRTIDAKNKLNTIKDREWWRPVAPIILTEYIDEWFEDAYESPFMLNTFKVKSNKKNLIKAITHLDNSARIQTVSKKDNDKLYDLLVKFYTLTGIPILCNTSLNDKGEPIINTIGETLNFALRKGIKVVYINGVRVLLHNHQDYFVKKPLEREYKMDYIMTNEIEKKLQKYNPYNIPKEILKIYYWRGKYNNKLKLTERKDAMNLIIAANISKNKMR